MEKGKEILVVNKEIFDIIKALQTIKKAKKQQIYQMINTLK